METAIKFFAMLAVLSAFWLLVGGIADKLVQPRLSRKKK